MDRIKEALFKTREKMRGSKFLDGSYPTNLIHRSSSCGAFGERDQTFIKIRTNDLPLSDSETDLFLLPYPWAPQLAALSSCFAFAPENTEIEVCTADVFHKQGNCIKLN